jgi:hypothetical protein
MKALLNKEYFLTDRQTYMIPLRETTPKQGFRHSTTPFSAMKEGKFRKLFDRHRIINKP